MGSGQLPPVQCFHDWTILGPLSPTSLRVYGFCFSGEFETMKWIPSWSSALPGGNAQGLESRALTPEGIPNGGRRHSRPYVFILGGP